MRLRRLAFPLLAVGLAGLLVSCRGTEQKPPTEQPIPIRVSKVERFQRPVYVAASGSVEAQETVDLAFQVGGRVASVLVDEGQRVRRGQTVASLDAADYRFGLDAAEAQVGLARASLDKAQAGTRAEELEQARINFDRVADDYSRYKQLYERKSMAPADFVKIEAAYKAAQAQYEMARNGARKEDRAGARSAVEQAEAQARVVRKRVADTRLTAPIAGLIARRGIDPGEMVGPGIPVLTIVNLDPVRVRVGIPENDIAGVRVGQRATVVIPALDGKEFEGKVELVGVAAEPSSRTFTTKILVPNREQEIRAGMIAEARVEGSTKIDALTIPGDAVVRDPQGATLVFVWFRDRNRVYARRVDVGTVRGRNVEILGGLKGDEMIVIAGQQKLREGAMVEVVQ